MRRALALAAITLAFAACEQTVHLYGSLDSGTSAGSGKGGMGGSGAFGSDAGGTDQHCSGGQDLLTFMPDTPQVVVVLDRSSNMNQAFPNSNDTHLTAAMHALYSEVSLYAMPKFNHPWTIHFSFVDFPDVGAGCIGTGECCAKDANVLSTGMFDMATMCESSPSASCVASNKRPIQAALEKADQYLTSGGVSGPRYVLLITDGDPQGGCTQDDCISAQSAVNALGNDHIALEVAAIGGAGTSSCLQDLAMTANGTLDSPSYAAASDSNSLGQIITEAVGATVCTGTLNNPPMSSSSLQVSMMFGTSTTPYGYGPRDGWTYDSNSGRLRLHGSLCDAYTANASGLIVTAGCRPGAP